MINVHMRLEFNKINDTISTALSRTINPLLQWKVYTPIPYIPIFYDILNKYMVFNLRLLLEDYFCFLLTSLDSVVCKYEANSDTSTACTFSDIFS